MLCFCLMTLLGISEGHADWWGDNGDSANAEDIDAGAQREETTNDDLVRDANGPGQPQNQTPSQNAPVYDGYGYPFAFGVPYGFSPLMGYGTVSTGNGAATR